MCGGWMCGCVGGRVSEWYMMVMVVVDWGAE